MVYTHRWACHPATGYPKGPSQLPSTTLTPSRGHPTIMAPSAQFCPFRPTGADPKSTPAKTTGVPQAHLSGVRGKVICKGCCCQVGGSGVFCLEEQAEGRKGLPKVGSPHARLCQQPHCAFEAMRCPRCSRKQGVREHSGPWSGGSWPGPAWHCRVPAIGGISLWALVSPSVDRGYNNARLSGSSEIKWDNPGEQQMSPWPQ